VAPNPKPPGQAIPRGQKGAAKGGWTTLPAAEDFKRPPNLPTRRPRWLKGTRDWWARLWASPMATTYVAADVEPLIRLATFVECFRRGELGATELAQMTALEDRFGISPKARRGLQWEVARASADDGKAEDQPLADVVDIRAV